MTTLQAMTRRTKRKPFLLTLPLSKSDIKSDNWKTTAEGKVWAHAKEAECLVRHLEAHKEIPLDVNFADVLFTKVDMQDFAGTIAVNPDVGKLDGKLTSDECLRALSYLFKTYPTVQALREDEHFRVPPPSRLAQYQPFDLAELGFRACPLTTSGKEGETPLRLSQTVEGESLVLANDCSQCARDPLPADRNRLPPRGGALPETKREQARDSSKYQLWACNDASSSP
ncbi:hypothetical protein PSEUBRA_001203 [Kalmanozyma brasiliensis GHG001]|uniref:uncharacterized protein n=1 Tax=Kalmanozyma brasiliensis (strain GHG001) TaxID=1365824 RepID=UPI002867BCC0|nr:uncharacterized protein PSEUBRA_001203 [Kalmanozyma brasiliensis GHG001]KAF6766901.1 hypothetical protein PSEUBRA_001203 [Kalmanozyma brasiliensis GHG001]